MGVLPARDIEASVRYDTDQLRGQLVWKIQAFNAWVAAVRLSPTGPLVMLADHLDGDTPLLVYRVEQLETSAAALRLRGWVSENGPFEIPNGPCYTFAIRREYDSPFTKTSGGSEPRICRSH